MLPTLVDVTLGASAPGAGTSPLLVIALPAKPALDGPLAALDARLGGALGRSLSRQDFRGSRDETLHLGGIAEDGPQRVLLVGMGKVTERRSALRRAGAIAARHAAKYGTGTLQFWAGALTGEEIEAVVVGLAAGAWEFKELKSAPPDDERRQPLASAGILVDAGADADAGLASGLAIAAGQALARRLAMMPGNLCTPEYLAATAEDIGSRHGMAVTVLGREEMERERMGSFLCVAQGTPQEPKLVVMEYRGGTDGARPVALVGKGLCFDSGGISIKPAAGMEQMKFDMCGAAGVLGAMETIARLQLPVNVVGLIGATTNMPSGTAVNPGDVVQASNGKYIEIINTDAEGRLVLADVLAYAKRFDPVAAIDAATLTGACVVALGHTATGAMGNDEALMREVVAAGSRAGEPVWELPLWDDYKELIRSDVADVKNSGGRAAGTITAALFLQEFVDGFPWVHLDIAGTAYTESDLVTLPRGPTGVPVGTFVEFVRARGVMTRQATRWLLGLGLLAGAVLQPATGAAQDTIRPPVRDTTVRIPIPPQPDTIARRDSAARTGGPVPAIQARADSMQPPLAKSLLPVLTDAALAPLQWTRDSLMATGAVTLADLLDRVPGLTSLRTTWLGTASAGAYLGDVARVRVFLDGIELNPEEPRGGAVFDLARVPLWALDDLRIERTAGEVRVHARSWQVERTTPYSRVDISTGDQDTDLFRFFFGRRFGNGLAVQAAVDQFSMTPDRSGATNSQTSLLARVGWARRAWQADAFVLRSTPRRGVLFDETNATSIPPIDLTRTEAYLRGGFGDVDGPFWVQGTAAALGYHYTGIRDPEADTVVVAVDPVTGDSTFTPILADTGRFEGQYTLTGGVRRGVLRLSATHRMRVIDGSTYQTPSARASAEWGMLALVASLEGKGADSIARQDVSARLAPLGFVRAGASVARRDDSRDEGRSGVDWRAEGALRLASLWLGGGVMQRDAALLRPPAVFNTADVATVDPAATGTFATVQGTLWGPLQLDMLGERWQDVGRAYRPQFSTRADVFIRSNFLKRFPTGNFGLHARMRHEYRSATFFPTATGLEQAPGHRIISSLLEIRLLDATLTYQFRNMMGTRVRMVPGFEMPRQTQLYGVRWTFWN